MKTDFFQSCGRCRVFHFCWHIGCSTFTASSFSRGNGGNSNLLQKDLCQHIMALRIFIVSATCGRPLSTHTSTENSWTLTGKSGSVSCGDTAPFSWVLVCTKFFCALQESVSPVLRKSYNQIPLAFEVKFPGHSQSPCQIFRFANLGP